MCEDARMRHNVLLAHQQGQSLWARNIRRTVKQPVRLHSCGMPLYKAPYDHTDGSRCCQQNRHTSVRPRAVKGCTKGCSPDVLSCRCINGRVELLVRNMPCAGKSMVESKARRQTNTGVAEHERPVTVSQTLTANTGTNLCFHHQGAQMSPGYHSCPLL